MRVVNAWGQTNVFLTEDDLIVLLRKLNIPGSGHYMSRQGVTILVEPGGGLVNRFKRTRRNQHTCSSCAGTWFGEDIHQCPDKGAKMRANGKSK